MITLFLCGDVMIGRGIDQVLARSVDPQLHERWARSAEHYVELAVEASGPIPRPVPPEYVWGAALDTLGQLEPDARIVNLETTLTLSDARWLEKEVRYRSHPENVAVLRAAHIDCCSLANNHVLDFGYPGLLETIDTLKDAGVQVVGAGRDLAEAEAPAFIDTTGGRVIVIGLAFPTSGVPGEWAAGAGRPGIHLVDGNDRPIAEHIATQLGPVRRPNDIVVASVHWGTNWGYGITAEQRRVAHRLVDVGGVDVVHGHSSHHPRGIEVYEGRLILYGCGDFITDYEGIGGYEAFRDDLVLAYVPAIDAGTGRLVRLTLVPFQLRRFQLARPAPTDVVWLRDNLDDQSRGLGTRVRLGPDGTLTLAS